MLNRYVEFTEQVGNIRIRWSGGTDIWLRRRGYDEPELHLTFFDFDKFIDALKRVKDAAEKERKERKGIAS